MRKEERAVLAAPTPIQVGGKTFEVKPLTLRDLAELEQKVLRDYKDEYIATAARNIHLLPEDQQQPFLLQAMREAQRLDIADMPAKYADVPQFHPDGKPVVEDGRVVTKREEVPIAQWWAANTIDGQLHAVWLSMRRAKPGMTLEDTDELFDTDEALSSVAGVVQEVSEPVLPDPTSPTSAPKRVRRRRSRSRRGK